MEKKRKGEGLTGLPIVDDEDAKIFEFLEREKKARQAESRQIEHPSPIVARTKKMPNIFAPNPKPKKKTLAEIHAEEDQAKREWEEDEAERKRQQR